MARRPPRVAESPLPAPTSLRPAATAAAAVAMVAFLVYLRTLCPGLAAGDAADLQTAAGSLGIAHPPGYPTYTLLGWLFSRLSPAEPAWGVNLMTALFGALAAGAATLVAAELTGLAVAGLAAGAALAFTPLFWQHSLAAEVFSMNAFLAAMLLWLGLRLAARPSPGRLVALAGVFGLAMSHHHTIVLLVPGLAVLAWPARRLLRGRSLGLAAAAFCAGLLPYLYPLLRAQANPGLNWDDPRTLGGLLHLVRRADYGTFSLLPGAARGLFREASAWDQVPLYLETIFSGTGLAVGLLALAGMAFLATRDRRALLALGLSWLLAGPGFLMYARYPLDDPFWIGVVQRFYLLPQVFVAVLAGCGAALLLRALPARAALPAGFLLAFVVAGLGLSHWREVDHSTNTVARDYVENLLEGVPEGAILLTLGDAPGMQLEYVRYVEGRRKDLAILDQDKLSYPWYVDCKRREHPSVTFPWKRHDGATATLADLVAANYGTRPIVLWRFVDDSLNGRFRLLPAGLTQRVAEPGEDPAPAELALLVEGLWAGYEKSSLERTWPPRSFDHLITSFYGFPFYSVGFEFEKAGQVEEALRTYTRALQVAPHYAPPYRRLGALEAATGRRREAKEHLGRYLELEPGAADRDEVRRMWEGL